MRRIIRKRIYRGKLIYHSRNRIIDKTDELLMGEISYFLFSTPSDTEETKTSRKDKVNNQKDKDDSVKDAYEEIPPEKCTAIQSLVQRVAKMSSFYVKENIEMFDLSQKLAIMRDDCNNIDERVRVLNRKFK